MRSEKGETQWTGFRYLPRPVRGCTDVRTPLPRDPGDARVPRRGLTDRHDLRVCCHRLYR